MNERWAPVVGYEGLYKVSDQGRVKSIERHVERGGHLMKVPGRLMRIGNHAPAYYSMVNLSRDGRQNMHYVHRLVLEAFVGPCPPGMETLHDNGVRADCRLENLHWGTHQENIRDVVRHGNAHGSKPKTHCKCGRPYDPSFTRANGHQRCAACEKRWKETQRLKRIREDTRCTSRILLPGATDPIRCKGAVGHSADTINVGDAGHERCHWNDWRHAMWTDASPDLIAEAVSR